MAKPEAKPEAKPVDFDSISGYYGFLSADNFSVKPGDHWNEFILAHTKGVCHIAKVNKVVLVHLTDGQHQNVWMGGPRYFTLGVIFFEDIRNNVIILPTLENGTNLKLTWHFSGGIVRKVTYKFYGQKLIAEFETLFAPPAEKNCSIVTVVEFQRMPNVTV